jgi:protein neuralized
LTSKPGYWAKAVSEAYISKGTVIHYYVAGNGDVHFGANGHDLGMFFSGIDTRQPLWAMIDLYGNCTSLEMVDSRSSLNNFSLNSSSGSTRAPSRNCDGIIGSNRY